MISRLCYELYKVDWKHSHMITKEREMDSIKNYYEGLVDDDTEYTYNDYLEEFGYDGELYVCYEEFCDMEYHDKEYMCSLLNNEELIVMYYKDINTDDDFKTIKWQILKEVNNMSKYAEIRNDFYDDIEHKVYIDAWFTEDDNEGGIVIAKVNCKTKEIEYLDNDARIDEYAQEIINETLSEIDNGDYDNC